MVSPNTGSTTITVSDFLTPATLPISGKIFVSAQEGDAVLEGDQMLFGESVATLQLLSGPNNPENNFFASQINNQNGTIDTSGTFGTRNANAAAGTNISAGRQGWDITAVDVSNQLAASQSNAVIRFTSDGDLYVPNALSLQIDSKGADLFLNKTADKTFAIKGENIHYSSEVMNAGTGEKTDIFFKDPIPAGTTFVAGSVTINGVSFPAYNPQTGFNIPDMDPGETFLVEFDVKVD